jgi:hypothetical protein
MLLRPRVRVNMRYVRQLKKFLFQILFDSSGYDFSKSAKRLVYGRIINQVDHRRKNEATAGWPLSYDMKE